MKTRDIICCIMAGLFVAMIVSMSSRMHNIGRTENIITAVIILAGLATAWVKNPYAFDPLPLETMTRGQKVAHWAVWIASYLPIYIYIQLGEGSYTAKAVLAVVFLTGCVLTKLESKKYPKDQD